MQMKAFINLYYVYCKSNDITECTLFNVMV